MILPIITIIIWFVIGAIYTFTQTKLPRLIMWCMIAVIVINQIEKLVGGIGL